jgi:PIN domain nuclease of toxin-antitoxin system
VLLLDTHILVWLAEGTGELSPSSVRRIDEARKELGLAVSAMTFWEVAMLARGRRLSLSLPVREWCRIVVETGGIVEIPVSGEIAIESTDLPGSLHGDPADRILIATARLSGWSLGTRDSRVLDYAEAGYVNAVAL